MTPLEKDIEKKLRQKVEALGGFCLKWVCPGWSGVPDRIVLLPGARIYFVETKRPKGGRLSALQRKWHEWLELRGFDVWTIWNEGDLEAFLKYLNLEGTPRDKRLCIDCQNSDTRYIDEPCRSCVEYSLWKPRR